MSCPICKVNSSYRAMSCCPSQGAMNTLLDSWAEFLKSHPQVAGKLIAQCQTSHPLDKPGWFASWHSRMYRDINAICSAYTKAMASRKTRWFPIQHKHSPHGERFRIPWAVAEKAFTVYFKNHKDQTIEELAARGGFSLIELIGLLADVEIYQDECQSDFFNKFSEERQASKIQEPKK